MGEGRDQEQRWRRGDRPSMSTGTGQPALTFLHVQGAPIFPSGAAHWPEFIALIWGRSNTAIGLAARLVGAPRQLHRPGSCTSRSREEGSGGGEATRLRLNFALPLAASGLFLHSSCCFSCCPAKSQRADPPASDRRTHARNRHQTAVVWRSCPAAVLSCRAVTPPPSPAATACVLVSGYCPVLSDGHCSHTARRSPPASPLHSSLTTGRSGALHSRCHRFIAGRGNVPQEGCRGAHPLLPMPPPLWQRRREAGCARRHLWASLRGRAAYLARCRLRLRFRRYTHAERGRDRWVGGGGDTVSTFAGWWAVWRRPPRGNQ